MSSSWQRDDVTVVVPCFNYAPYLEEALQAIAAQTARPAEVIVVDDGSTDGSPDVVRRLAADLAETVKIRLIEQSNSGVAVAMNVGIAAANTAYVAHIDADDRVHPTFLERLAQALDSNERAGVAYCEMRMFGAERGIVRVRPFRAGSLLLVGNYVPGASMVRKAAFEQTPGFDPSLAMWEDWDLWLAVAEAGWTGEPVFEPLYEWRRHEAARNNQQPKKVRRKVRRALFSRHPRLVLRSAPTLPYWLLVAVALRLRHRLGLRGHGPQMLQAQNPWVREDPHTA